MIFHIPPLSSPPAHTCNLSYWPLAVDSDTVSGGCGQLPELQHHWLQHSDTASGGPDQLQQLDKLSCERNVHSPHDMTVYNIFSDSSHYLCGGDRKYNSLPDYSHTALQYLSIQSLAIVTQH